MTVKVCGMRTVADVVAGIESGADALGFVFEPETPRYVGHDENLLSFLGQLHVRPSFVAVFGSCPGFSHPAFRLVQALRFTGDTLASRLLTLRPSPDFDLATARETAQALHVAGLVVDAYHPGQAGGTGELVNFDFARRIVDETPYPVFLAGGLNPDNVAEAIRYVRPYGVDASSGLESAPGVKDHTLIQRFVEAAKKA